MVKIISLQSERISNLSSMCFSEQLLLSVLSPYIKLQVQLVLGALYAYTTGGEFLCGRALVKKVLTNLQPYKPRSVSPYGVI
jgi:hypothetical protein